MYDNKVWRVASRQTIFIISWYSFSVPIPEVQSALSDCIFPRISSVRGAQPHTDITKDIPHRELWGCQGSVHMDWAFARRFLSFFRKRETPEQKAFQTAVSVQAFAEVY